MFSKREWTKEEYLSWAKRMTLAANPEWIEHDDFVVTQIKRFDPQAAEKMEANLNIYRSLATHLLSRLER